MSFPEHVRRVLAHRERVNGASHPEVALDVHEVGRLLRLPRVRRRLARVFRLTGAVAKSCEEARRAWEEMTVWRKAYAQETTEAWAELGRCRG